MDKDIQLIKDTWQQRGRGASFHHGHLRLPAMIEPSFNSYTTEKGEYNTSTVMAVVEYSLHRMVNERGWPYFDIVGTYNGKTAVVGKTDGTT